MVVAEKNKVARAIASTLIGKYKVIRRGGIPAYIGGNYVVIGVAGHILNLDFVGYEKWSLETIEELFDAKVNYKVRKGAWRYLRALQVYGRKAKALYLALDNDAEGEHIGWEVLSIVKRVNPSIRVYRVRFSSLDPMEIREAFRNPTQLNRFWVEKSATRQEVDLKCGVTITRFLTLVLRRRIKLPYRRVISYGPCQSPTLRLIVEPYIRWRAGEKYRYEVHLILTHPLYGDFSFSKSFKSREEAESVKEAILKVRKAKVVATSIVHEKQKPPIPLDAYELASRASKFLGLPSRKTMAIAEDLYRDGLISYPRTETQVYRGVNIKGVLHRLARHPNKEISKVVISILNQEKIRATKGKHDDKAHPPIYPVRAPPKRLSGDHAKLYDLIVKHFLATLMPPAEVRRKRVVISIGPLRLKAEGVRVIKPGYLVIYKYEWPKEKELPLSEGDILKLSKVSIHKVKIKPNYLTESALIRLMRAKGIGTDSTMHEHIQTNIERGYAVRRRGRLIPTPLGVTLVDLLMKLTPELIDVDLRSKMERQFSLVGEGVLNRREVVEKIVGIYRDAFHKLCRKVNILVDELAKAYKVGRKPLEV